MALLVLLVAASLHSAETGETKQQGPPTFSEDVKCAWVAAPADLTCDGGLSVSGSSTSSITIHGVSHPIRVIVDSGEEKPTVVDLTDADSDVVHVTVHKTRWLFPTYKRGSGKSVFNLLMGPATLQSTKKGETIPATAVHHISGVDHPTITVAVTDRETDASTKVEKLVTRTFVIPFQFEAWRLESGGIYAYAWAHDQQLVTSTIKPAASQTALPAITRVVAIRRGDEFGPSTGVAFNFHPANYPNFGWEFGTAVRGTADYAFFIGPTLRLLRLTDHALVTIGSGLSLVKVTDYPSISASTVAELPSSVNDIKSLPTGFYVADDPLLTGRAHYVRRPYVSLGISLTFDSIKKGQ
jgi:hypothetical protein